MSVLDEYMIDPKLSLLDKTRIQAQVLVPVLRALRSERDYPALEVAVAAERRAGTLTAERLDELIRAAVPRLAGDHTSVLANPDLDRALDAIFRRR